METLRYSLNKLVLRIVGAVLGCAGAVYLFSNSDLADSLPFPLDSFGGDFGHYLISPITMVSSAIFGWLAASRLISGRLAVECLPDELRVTTFWGRTRIPWDDLGHVYLVRKRRRWVWVQHFLVFHVAGGGMLGARRVRLPLGATELSRDRFEEFRLAILARKRAGGARPPSAAAPAGAVAGQGFDPDAALARYLARKALEQPVPDPVPAPRAAPVRPVFGRKAS